jgi:hypothetical protein
VLALPGAATDIVGSIDVVVATGGDIAGVNDGAFARLSQPPAIGAPILGGLVANGDLHDVGGLVADAQVSGLGVGDIGGLRRGGVGGWWRLPTGMKQERGERDCGDAAEALGDG